MTPQPASAHHFVDSSLPSLRITTCNPKPSETAKLPIEKVASLGDDSILKTAWQEPHMTLGDLNEFVIPNTSKSNTDGKIIARKKWVPVRDGPSCYHLTSPEKNVVRYKLVNTRDLPKEYRPQNF